MNNLPKVVTRQCFGTESNLRPLVTSGLQVWHVTVRLPSLTYTVMVIEKKTKFSTESMKIHHFDLKI